MIEKDTFVHHVYFWLKQSGNPEDRYRLVEGLKTLTGLPVIVSWHIGQPAGTDRGVIERSYDVSWLLLFRNKEDQDSYQADPVHLKFVTDCAHLWSKVVVYDSESI